MRNSIQHLDERIEHGVLDSFGLTLANDFVWIADGEMTYDNLASSIRKLYNLISIINAPTHSS
jgi:hypothetical protein